MKSFKALIKREFWEHKGAIFYTPLVMAACFAALMLFGGFVGDTLVIDNEYRIEISEHLPQALEEFEALPDDVKTKGVQLVLYSPIVILGFVLLVISMFYALGSLYDERKDRSILFWKSLPVSDTETVMSKFVAICFMTPVIYFAVIALFQLYLLLYATLAAWFAGHSGMSLWGASNLFVVLFNSLFSLIAASLWLAPLWAWFMFASVWARKVPFLWGGLPILMLTVAEALIFKSTSFIEMIGRRIADGFVIQNSNMHWLTQEEMFDTHVMRWYESFLSLDFWAGIAIAAILLAAAIYTRRYRDES